MKLKKILTRAGALFMAVSMGVSVCASDVAADSGLNEEYAEELAAAFAATGEALSFDVVKPAMFDEEAVSEFSSALLSSSFAGSATVYEVDNEDAGQIEADVAFDRDNMELTGSCTLPGLDTDYSLDIKLDNDGTLNVSIPGVYEGTVDLNSYYEMVSSMLASFMEQAMAASEDTDTADDSAAAELPDLTSAMTLEKQEDGDTTYYMISVSWDAVEDVLGYALDTVSTYASYIPSDLIGIDGLDESLESISAVVDNIRTAYDMDPSYRISVADGIVTSAYFVLQNSDSSSALLVTADFDYSMPEEYAAMFADYDSQKACVIRFGVQAMAGDESEELFGDTGIVIASGSNETSSAAVAAFVMDDTSYQYAVVTDENLYGVEIDADDEILSIFKLTDFTAGADGLSFDYDVMAADEEFAGSVAFTVSAAADAE